MLHNAGKKFMAVAFQANAYMLHILTKSVSREFSNSMKILGRFHFLSHRAYKIVQEEPN